MCSAFNRSKRQISDRNKVSHHNTIEICFCGGPARPQLLQRPETISGRDSSPTDNEPIDRRQRGPDVNQRKRNQKLIVCSLGHVIAFDAR
jgi:hypothetical protein